MGEKEVAGSRTAHLIYCPRSVNIIIQKQQTKKSSKIPKIISGILAIISIAVIGFCFIPSTLFWICWEALAAILVAFGCIGEWWLFLHPSAATGSAHRCKELLYITTVAVGVTMELFALAHAIPEALRLEAELERLKAARQWRTIQQSKIDSFITLTKSTPKVPIKIIVGMTDYETENFRTDFQKMLFQAGFTNQELIRKDGISINETALDAEDVQETPVQAFILFHRNNGAREEIIGFPNPKNTNQLAGVFYYTDTNGVVGKMIDSFYKIGIPIVLKDSSGMLKPDEIGFFIPEKLY